MLSDKQPLSQTPAHRYAARPMASLRSREPLSLLHSQLPREHDGVSEATPTAPLALSHRASRGRFPVRSLCPRPLRIATPPARRRACYAGNPSVCCRSQLPREHDGVSVPRLRLRLRYRTGWLRTFSDKKPLSPATGVFRQAAFHPAAAHRYAARLKASLLYREPLSLLSQPAPGGA